ncbi:MAG: GNAT family N-acetyltransferase [Lachnospiraceae bacterium]|nr:GNAT family N-acetyltransferase [Ruminococcus sp.]MCM1276454.1 GNAT family N-acetyltransferase [Lachnospiraceae bacterium]
MDFSEYLDMVKRQLAVDFNCAPEDFDRAENVVTVSAANEGRRTYSDEKYFFQMATFGGNAVLSADEALHPFLREFMADIGIDNIIALQRKVNTSNDGYIGNDSPGTGHWLFEQDKLAVLERELNKHGYRLSPSHHKYLPKYDVKAADSFPVRWFETRGELEPFYGGRFPNALCERYLEKRPDRLAVCAYDGDEIMGMAGCSEDAPGFLQIGVDVFPKYRGRGAGTYLVLLMKNEIIKRGGMPVYETAAANIRSQNVAVNCGFRPAWVEIEAEKIPEEKPKISDTWVTDMKEEMEDYIEEQGIYIRQ